MDSTELGLIAAIHDTPRDDLPRLIYADWLEEQGDPYGEFIRLQCVEPRVLVLRRDTSILALPKWSPESEDRAQRILDLFPLVISSERFAYWHLMENPPPLFRGLGYLLIRDHEVMRFDPPLLVRLSVKVSVCGRLLEQLLPLHIMERVDFLTLEMPLPEMPWDGYEDQLLALLGWPGLDRLSGVRLMGAPCEAAERLASRVSMDWVR